MPLKTNNNNNELLNYPHFLSKNYVSDSYLIMQFNLVHTTHQWITSVYINNHGYWQYQIFTEMFNFPRAIYRKITSIRDVWRDYLGTFVGVIILKCIPHLFFFFFGLLCIGELYKLECCLFGSNLLYNN